MSKSESLKPDVDGAFTPKSGLDADAYKAVADAMGPVLADSYQLFIKTQGVHWNVSGPNFHGLHKLTEAQYQDMYAAIDLIAERIRALGQPAPATYTAYGKLGRIRDEQPEGETIDHVSMLIRDNDLLCQTLRDAVDTADDADDVVTADLLTGRLAKHEQNGWMLRMLLG